jgi:glycosyltransferase involved in cell wall biosynthesis
MTGLVIHIIPYDGVGGVEVAARTVADGQYGDLAFRKLYIADKSGRGRYPSENHPGAYFVALAALLKARPTMVIASLWRSCAVLLAIKALRPRTCAVTFLHSAVDMHPLDRWLNRLAMLCSREIWADSRATIEARVPQFLRQRARVISFLTERLQSQPVEVPAPRFIFWGRLHWQKDLPHAVRLFARIAATHPSASFTIIGPNDGGMKDIEAEIQRLGVSGVQFLGRMPRDRIFEIGRAHSFYLQTSVEEGAAMSVMEAMQLGLVPVVTPVGEIPAYCRDGVNAVVISDDEGAAAKVEALLADPPAYAALSARAISTWQQQPLYRDSVIESCWNALA